MTTTTNATIPDESTKTTTQVFFITASGERREVWARSGQNLMQAAVNNLVPGIVGECGGELSCATCHVYVEPDWLDLLEPVSPDEEVMLEATAAEPTHNSRLACQLRCSAKINGLTVRVPSEQ